MELRADEMFVSTDEILLGRELLAQLGAVLGRDRRVAARGPVRLFARLPPPEALAAGEAFRVDLADATLEHLVDGVPITTFSLEVIGTLQLHPTAGDEVRGRFLWGWWDATVPVHTHAALHHWIRQDPELAPLAALRGFEIARWRIAHLAQLVAVRSGALGAYPVPHGDFVRLLALRDASVEDASAPQPEWCLGCGEVPDAGEHLHHGAWGGVCRACCDRMVRAARAGGAAPVARRASAAELGDCFLCGDPAYTVPLGAGRVHLHCVEHAWRALVLAPRAS